MKSTLGPKGMNKILQSVGSNSLVVTNDGATILRSIHLDNAAAKILVNISKVQDDEVGDGTTSVCVLASELLREAEKMIEMKIHPQTIVEGYRIASKAALKALDEAATMFSHARDTGLTPREFVDNSRKANKLSTCRVFLPLPPLFFVFYPLKSLKG